MTPRNLCDLLEAAAHTQADRIGFRFLSDQGEYDRLTYAQLRARALAVANQIGAVCRPGDRALLLLETSPEFVAAFFGCLYAGVIAVPTVASASRREVVTRGAGIAADCEPACILKDSSRTTLADSIMEKSQVAATPLDVTRDGGGAGDVCPARPHELALLQYTSGSTSDPKGVRVSHANLLHNAHAIGVSFGFSSESCGVGWVPLFHDMGLVGNVIVPLFWRFPVSLMSPPVMLKRPGIWLKAVSEARATVSGGPDFAYRLCADRVPDAELDGIDLRSWRVAYTGGEPVSPTTLERFTARFGPHGFHASSFLPCYGLAEATLLAAGRGSDAPPVVVRADRRQLERESFAVGDGDPGAAELVGHHLAPTETGIEVRIVARDSDAELPDGAIGEITVAGGSVSSGYWGEAPQPEGARRLRTGDLGVIHQGMLLVVGRTKDTMVLLGRNYHPNDIESVLQSVLSADVCAFGVPTPSGERLVVVIGVRKGQRVEEERAAVISTVRRLLAEHFTLRPDTIVFLPSNRLSRTSSGKLRRHEMRRAYVAGEFGSAADSADAVREPPAASTASGSTAVESGSGRYPVAVARLIAKLADLLEGVESRDIAESTPIVSLGMDSLAAMAFRSWIEREFGVSISAADLLDGATVGEVAHRLADGPQGAPLPVAHRTVEDGGRDERTVAVAADELDAAVHAALLRAGARLRRRGPLEFFQLREPERKLTVDEQRVMVRAFARETDVTYRTDTWHYWGRREHYLRDLNELWTAHMDGILVGWTGLRVIAGGAGPILCVDTMNIRQTALPPNFYRYTLASVFIHEMIIPRVVRNAALLPIAFRTQNPGVYTLARALVPEGVHPPIGATAARRPERGLAVAGALAAALSPGKLFDANTFVIKGAVGRCLYGEASRTFRIAEPSVAKYWSEHLDVQEGDLLVIVVLPAVTDAIRLGSRYWSAVLRDRFKRGVARSRSLFGTHGG